MKSKLFNLGFLLVEQLMCVCASVRICLVYASRYTLGTVYATQAILMPKAYFLLFLVVFVSFFFSLWKIVAKDETIPYTMDMYQFFICITIQQRFDETVFQTYFSSLLHTHTLTHCLLLSNFSFSV